MCGSLPPAVQPSANYCRAPLDRQQDDATKFRAAIRTQTLQLKGRGVDYNVLTGAPLLVLLLSSRVCPHPPFACLCRRSCSTHAAAACPSAHCCPGVWKRPPASRERVIAHCDWTHDARPRPLGPYEL